mmetsp:Transcript_52586/g.125579  ORF Transcript_52586/g.125579 Transcript_52586/m.125579 type:complete len:162 (-) Transcript_52586:435-920(-)
MAPKAITSLLCSLKSRLPQRNGGQGRPAKTGAADAPAAMAYDGFYLSESSVLGLPPQDNNDKHSLATGSSASQRSSLTPPPPPKSRKECRQRSATNMVALPGTDVQLPCELYKSLLQGAAHAAERGQHRLVVSNRGEMRGAGSQQQEQLLKLYEGSGRVKL